jgi:hypothetical protein
VNKQALQEGQDGAIAAWTGRMDGAPGEIRTPDPQIRSLVLYPAELRVRGAQNLGMAVALGKFEMGHGAARNGRSTWSCSLQARSLRLAAGGAHPNPTQVGSASACEWQNVGAE